MVEVRSLGIILANDLMEYRSVISLVEQINDQIDAIKLGLPAILERGGDLVEEIKSITGKPILADFKTADIGFKEDEIWSGTNSKIIEKTAEMGFDYLTFHPFPGLSSTRECIATAQRVGIRVLALPHMTAKGAELFFGHPLDQEYSSKVLGENGVDPDLAHRCETTSDLIVALCDSFGVDGYIGPANRPEILKRYRRFTNRPVFATGIGRQSDSSPIKDQLRNIYSICGAKSAAIVGSYIYKSSDPVGAAREITIMRDRVIADS